MWKKSVNRVKLSETCKEQKVIVESSYGLDESDEEYLQAAEEESHWTTSSTLSIKKYHSITL